MEKKKGGLRFILQLSLRIILALAILAAVVYGPILAWAWITDMKNERIAREIIDPKAAAYLEEHYPGNDFEVEESYNVFKDNCFRVKIQSRSSQDTHFYLDYDYKSYELTRDSYENQVLGGWNTRERLAEGYDEAVKACLEGMDGLLYLTTGLCRYEESASRDLHMSPDGLDTKTLTLDGAYDIADMGDAYGYLDVKFLEDDGNVNVRQACERLLELDRLLTEHGIGYSVLEITLQNGEYPNITKEFYIYAVQKDDLRGEDALAHLQQMWDEQEAYRQSVKAQKESDG